jgi:hypothetical protein
VDLLTAFKSIPMNIDIMRTTAICAVLRSTKKIFREDSAMVAMVMEFVRRLKRIYEHTPNNSSQIDTLSTKELQDQLVNLPLGRQKVLNW